MSAYTKWLKARGRCISDGWRWRILHATMRHDRAFDGKGKDCDKYQLWNVE